MRGGSTYKRFTAYEVKCNEILDSHGFYCCWCLRHRCKCEEQYFCCSSSSVSQSLQKFFSTWFSLHSALVFDAVNTSFTCVAVVYMKIHQHASTSFNTVFFLAPAYDHFVFECVRLKFSDVHCVCLMCKGTLHIVCVCMYRFFLAFFHRIVCILPIKDEDFRFGTNTQAKKMKKLRRIPVRIHSIHRRMDVIDLAEDK